MASLAFTTVPATSWGRVIRHAETVARPAAAGEVIAWSQSASRAATTGTSAGRRLAVGARRSYGDTCLAADAAVLEMTGLRGIAAFDPVRGVVRAEAGLTLGALMQAAIPAGWFPAVTPGTRHVTLGGAVAHDVHGKNHVRAGAFGCHVLDLTLLRSDTGPVRIAAATHPALFAATIGGMGLTGVILDVTLQLAPVASAELAVETIPMAGLDDYFRLQAESVATHEHIVAWIDCTRGGRDLGRGIFTRADWAPDGLRDSHAERALRVPMDVPGFLLNPLSLRLFNAVYRRARMARAGHARQHYSAFFHPLDAIGGWNRLYGPRGLYQYQAVLPPQEAAALREMLRQIAASGDGSFLVVLKSFGTRRSPGLLSFPRPGHTVALDFRNRGAATLALFDRLDRIVAAAGGRLYPAKDGRMPRGMFEAGYPALATFRRSVDPACISDFWRRMTA